MARPELGHQLRARFNFGLGQSCLYAVGPGVKELEPSVGVRLQDVVSEGHDASGGGKFGQDPGQHSLLTVCSLEEGMDIVHDQQGGGLLQTFQTAHSTCEGRCLGALI